MIKHQAIWAFALAVICLAGCRKEPVDALSTEERRIYITNRDEAVTFSDYKTFSMADVVVVVDGNSSQQQLTTADQAYLQAFTTAMQSRGYTLVDKTASPDLGVQVSRIIRTSTGVVSIPGYYDYWDPLFWGSGYGSGFGWDSPVFWQTATYQVQEGMLAFDIIDLKNAAANNNNLRIVWNGLVRGPGLTTGTTAGAQVAQLFDQSTYINAN